MSNPIPIGICQSPENLAKVAPGYDYVELTVMGALNPLIADDEFDMAALESIAPPVRCNNSFVPGSVKMVGPGVDWDQVEAYATKGIERAAHLGSETIVFGSGAARMVPEGWSRPIAWGQIVRFLHLCGGLAEDKGITIAIEPLNRGESNILNSYAEGVQMAKDVGHAKVKVLADIYHMEMESEPLGTILDAPEFLAHVHLADTGRLYPGSGSYPLPELFDILHDLNYAGRASVECGWGDDLTAESAAALAYLRELAAAR